jgi:predicted metal-dependent peptidase
MNIIPQQENRDKIENMANEVLRLAKDTITVRFRFFDSAIARIKHEFKYGINGFISNGDIIYVDPVYLLKEYMEEQGIAVRMYLHVLLHLVFMHQFQYDKLNEKYWNMATDIAVENIILEMDFKPAALSRDMEERDRLMRLGKRVSKLTADMIYREFMIYSISNDTEKDYIRLFTMDFHDKWKQTGDSQSSELVISEEEWRKITKRIQTELKSFSKGKGGSESLDKNIDEAVRERYNYREILERFTVMGEQLSINDDEFDYVYYTYGLRTYGNLPLVEPLEYKEEKKIKEFVIAIDTSASCKGDIVKQFVEKTYEILMDQENFFHKINIHIVQCDAQIQSDTKITNEDEFKDFIENGKITGFGSTDFRPVFDYVDDLKDKGEFENLKGLIYFTDGYGIYPEHMPDYDVIFAFLEEDENRAPVPGWAIKVVLDNIENI